MHIKDIEQCRKTMIKHFPETTAKVWNLFRKYYNENDELIAEFKHTLKGIAFFKLKGNHYELFEIKTY